MKKVIKISNLICGALLVALGFSACGSSGTKYGAPDVIEESQDTIKYNDVVIFPT